MTLQERYDHLTDVATQQWLSSNEHTDPHRVLLNPPKELINVKEDLAGQLTARKKARKKLPTFYKEEKILWPPALSIEQASSEATADYKASLISGKKLTDLTGGTGIDLLAFSKKFESVTYVEQNEWLCKVFQHNVDCLLKKNISITNATAEKALGNIEDGQWVYLDPARRDKEKNKVFLLEDCSPNLLEILPRIQSKRAKTMVKLSPLLDLQHIISVLQPYRVLVLAVQNDVKEVLAFIGADTQNEAQIEAVDLKHGVVSNFSFNQSSESKSTVSIDHVASFIYEPNAAILKAGAFKSVATNYNLKKLHPNTHLYTSEQLDLKFPGRVFKVIQELTGTELKSKYRKSELHVLTRNYPQNASQITKKYQLKESGDQYLIGFTDYKGQKKMMLTDRVKTDQNED